METFKAMMYVFWTFIKEIWGRFCLVMMFASMIFTIVLVIGWRITGSADISKWGTPQPEVEQTQCLKGEL